MRMEKTIQQDNIIRPSSLISVPEIPINSICGQIIISWNENLRLQSWLIHFYTPHSDFPLVAAHHLSLVHGSTFAVSFVNDFVCYFLPLSEKEGNVLWTEQFKLTCSAGRSLFYPFPLPCRIIAIHALFFCCFCCCYGRVWTNETKTTTHLKSDWIPFKIASNSERGAFAERSSSDMHWYVINSDQFSHSFPVRPNIYFSLIIYVVKATRIHVCCQANREKGKAHHIP